MIRSVLLAAVLAACHSSSPSTLPAEPVERPPLPPASGTPIGILLDEQAQLKLRPEQIEKLRELDRRLAVEVEELDATARAAARPPEPPDAGAGPGGGMGGPPGGGMGGGMGGPPGGGMGAPPGGGRRGGHRGPPPGAPHGDGPGHHDERAARIREAIQHALDVLDPDQRERAEQILDDHGATDTGKQLPPPPGDSAPKMETAPSRGR